MRTNPRRLALAHVLVALLIGLTSALSQLPSSPVARAAQTRSNLITVTLLRVDDESILGWVFLSAPKDEQTYVWAILSKSEALAIDIYQGSCDDHQSSPTYPLDNIDAVGESETLLDIPLGTLLDDDHVIKVQQPGDTGEPIACQTIEPGESGDEDSLSDTAVIARNDDVISVSGS
jgi:hypothetical protein